MPAKKDKINARRVNSLKSTIAVMKKDGSINQKAYDNMVRILDGKMDSPMPGLLAEGTFRSMDTYVGRVEIPDEIPPPVAEPAQDYAPVAEDELVPEPPLAEVPVQEQELAPVLEEALDVVPAPDYESALAQDDDPDDEMPCWPRPKKIKKKSMIVNKIVNPKKSVIVPPPPTQSEWELMTPNGDSDKKENLDGNRIESPIESIRRNMSKNEVPSPPETECGSKVGCETKLQRMSLTELETEKGCLFLTCIKCASMVMIKFHDRLLPFMPIVNEVRYENRIVMTTCKSCEISNTDSFSFGGKTVVSHAQQFNDMNIHPILFSGSNMMKVAEAVAGEHVRMMTHDGKLSYMDRHKVMDEVSSLDCISSLDVSRIMDGDNYSIKLPFLRGGFI
ncbi:hypothetical protein LTR86_010992 [Recurvomyces mirabilis]|nr:hypothetical protein LTR86_010992 [Recurvomyces mirabilis]